MKPWIVVSYYTNGTFYKDLSVEFKKSAIQHKIPHLVAGVPNLKDWSKNTNYKPTFLLQALKELKGLDIIWVDIDAKFNAYPKLFDDLECTIAAHEFDQRKYYGKHHVLKELLSGTVFLRNNDEALSVVQRWTEECKRKPKQWDQKSLQTVVGENYYKLPGEYCTISGRMRDIKHPIIEHFQASRKVRKNKQLLR